MNNKLRNKPCLCGSNKKMKKCCGIGNYKTYQNSRIGIKTFKNWGLEISCELGMECDYEIIDTTSYNGKITERLNLFGEDKTLCLDRRWIDETQKVCWVVETLRIHSDKRGQGIGSKVMDKLIEISKRYKCPLVLTPIDLDHLPTSKINSVNYLNNYDELLKEHSGRVGVGFMEMVKKVHLDKVKVFDEVANENVRKNLHQRNSLRLECWYRGLGFIDYYTDRIMGWKYLQLVGF